MQDITGIAPKGAHSLAPPVGQGACAQTKWQILTYVEEGRETLGLKGTTISLLRAMISLLPGTHISTETDDRHICFASNEALSRRTHVSVQTIERHIARLVDIGLLRRVSSGNGKRWARRDHDGRVVLASGLSLLPLVERSTALEANAKTVKNERNVLADLRAQVASALITLQRINDPSDVLISILNNARRILRRKPRRDVLEGLLVELESKVPSQSSKATEPTNLRGADKYSEGHKEPDLNRSVEEKEKKETLVSPHEMERAFPKLCARLRTSGSQSECDRRMDFIAAEIGLGRVWTNVRSLGALRQFIILGYVLERMNHIKKPRAYTAYLARGLENLSITCENLLQGARANMQNTEPT